MGQLGLMARPAAATASVERVLEHHFTTAEVEWRCGCGVQVTKGSSVVEEHLVVNDEPAPPRTCCLNCAIRRYLHPSQMGKAVSSE